MFTVEDFIDQYIHYTDEELMNIHSNISDYGPEAQEALRIVIQKKGGYEALEERLKQHYLIQNEIKRIERETTVFGSKGVDASFIKTVTDSQFLPKSTIDQIIDNKHAEVQLELEDQKIKPRTIFGSIVGGTIASIVGGTLWGLSLIYSGRIFHMLLVGLVLLCYGIIRISTRQTRKNAVVLITTIVAVVLALLIGQLLYDIVGYKP